MTENKERKEKKMGAWNEMIEKKAMGGEFPPKLVKSKGNFSLEVNTKCNY